MRTEIMYMLYLLGVLILVCSVIWLKKSRCRQSSLYERDLLYDILNKAETMVVVWKDDLTFLSMNPYMRIELGFEEADTKEIFRSIFGIREDNCKERADELLRARKNTEQVISYKDEKLKYVMWRSVIWHIDNQGVRTILSMGFDITERVRLSEELKLYADRIKSNADTIRRLAFEDELTGLYNKRKFLLEGHKLLNSSKENQQYALIYICIDKLNFIFNIYGEKAGDAVIINTAERIKKILREDSICCRSRDGEFGILLKIDNEEDIMIFYKELQESISKISIKENMDYKLEIIGAAIIYPKQGDDMDKLYKNVCFVMKDMKGKKNSSLELFNSKIKEAILEQQAMAIELKEATVNNEFELYYQPKIDVITEKVVGMEALIRWKHNKKGLIPPDKFIPIAEKTGLIVEIGRWGLIEACRQNKKWQEMGYPRYVVSVNISAVEFYQSNMVDIIKEALKVTGLEARYLEIELTESMALIDKEQTIRKMNEIRELGIRVALDDFGTGYSSLSYLKALPIDVLKLDRAFVIEIENDTISKNITLSMIELAKLLNIQTVAEGVETKTQVELLKEMGCNMIQGYYYSKPIPADVFEEMYMKQ